MAQNLHGQATRPVRRGSIPVSIPYDALTVAVPSRARLVGLLGLVALSTPLALVVETGLRRLMMPPDFDAVRAWLSPALTPWAWATVPAAVAATGLGWWIFRVLVRRELRARRPGLTQAQARAKAEREAVLLASSAPQVPAVIATMLLMMGAEVLPVAMAMGVAMLGVLSLTLACNGGAELGSAAAPELREGELAAASDPGLADRAQGVSSSQGGRDRVGLPAPAWGEMEWLHTGPLTLEGLRGRVVLIRFWTDTCPFCRATAPALAELDADYRERGVTVIGMYHPKPRGTVRTPAEVAAAIEDWGWRFPVALDTHWAVIDAFWLDHGPRDATSASFVLDRQGVIRYVHPGPEFHPGGPAEHESCRRDYAEIRATLDALIAEPVAG
jgi:thiol-disulfide isomerase/thioredoxin